MAGRGSWSCRRCWRRGPTRRATPPCPGYTHLQRAQPVLLAHHLLAHGWALARDVDRLLATIARLDVSPLGAGALAGSSLPARSPRHGRRPRLRRHLRQQPRRRLRPRLRGRGAVRPRPVGVHLSRIGEEWVLWTSEELGFARLDDAYATGLLDAPAEEEPRHRRAGPGQDRPARRPRRRLPHHAQGPAAGLQPGPAGGQGAAVRRRRPGLAGSRRAGRDDRHGHVRHGADGGGGRRRPRWPPPTWPSGSWLGACRSGRPTPSSAPWCGRRWSRARRRWPTWWRPTPRLGAEAAALVAPGVAVARRTTPGGGGPVPVAGQLDRFRRRLDADRARLG